MPSVLVQPAAPSATAPGTDAVTPHLVPPSTEKTPREDHPAPAPTPGLGERELRIDIYPRGADYWIGTRAQLEAEGLIPVGCEWPSGADELRWEAGPFGFWLQRSRPRDFKGPRKSWVNADNWCLRRRLTSLGLDGFEAARRYREKQDRDRDLWLGTPAAFELMHRYGKALEDKRFRAFKALLVPRRKKRMG